MEFRAQTLALAGLLILATTLALRVSRPVSVDPGVVAQDVSLDPQLGDEETSRRLKDADELLDHQELGAAEEIFLSLAQEAAEDSPAQGWALLGLGRVSKDRGLTFSALADYRQALVIFQETGDRRAESVAHHNLGAAFAAVGELELARDHHQKSLDTRTNDSELAISLSHLATLDDMSGDHALALASFRGAFALRRVNRAESEREQLQGLATILDRMGTALAQVAPSTCGSIDCRELSRRAFESALRLQETANRPRDRAITTANLGSLAIVGCGRDSAWCHPEQAVGHLEDALTQLERQEHSGDYQAALRAGLARALRHAGDLPAAERTALLGLEAVERQRAKALRRRRLRTTFLARHHPLYDELVSVLVRRDALEPGKAYDLRALGVAERARGRDLLDRIESMRHSALPAPWPVELGPEPVVLSMNQLESERLLLLDHLPCQRVIDPQGVDDTLRRIDEIQVELRSLTVEDLAPLGATTPSPDLTAAPDLEGLRRRLDPGTALLFYHLGVEQSFLWWIDAHRFESFDLPPRSQIEERVQTVHRVMARGEHFLGSERRQQEQKEELSLGHDLLAPVAPWLEGASAPERLIIFPDGALHSLPFAALPNPVDEGRLVERYDIAILPSLTLWHALEERELARAADPRFDRRRLLTVVADAIYSADDPRLGGRATESDLLCNPPPPLPASALEADFLRSLVAQDLHQEYLRFDATREVLMGGALAGSRIVHLAVHGALDEARPELSHLTLSRFDAEARPTPSRVFTHELDDLSLDADLVVLSACDSGRGKLVRGEGVLGMTQAMLAAGASRALVSLWPVSDRTTAELMQHFYHALLGEELSPVAALARAQRRMLEDPALADPNAWAGFLLVGDWRGELNKAESTVF